MNFEELKEEANRYELAEVTPGVYLSTAKALTKEQEEWADEDPCKNMDFSTAPYWVTTDDGQEPLAVYDEEDLCDAVPDWEDNTCIPPKNIVDLFLLMKEENPWVYDKQGDWRTDLPTFGGKEAHSPLTWSWSKTQLIYGSCAEDLALIPREE